MNASFGEKILSDMTIIIRRHQTWGWSFSTSYQHLNTSTATRGPWTLVLKMAPARQLSFQIWNKKRGLYYSVTNQCGQAGSRFIVGRLSYQWCCMHLYSHPRSRHVEPDSESGKAHLHELHIRSDSDFIDRWHEWKSRNSLCYFKCCQVIKNVGWE